MSMREGTRIPKKEYEEYVKVIMTSARLGGELLCPCCYGTRENLGVFDVREKPTGGRAEVDVQLIYIVPRMPCPLCTDGKMASALITWRAMFNWDNGYPGPSLTDRAARTLGLAPDTVGRLAKALAHEAAERERLLQESFTAKMAPEMFQQQPMEQGPDPDAVPRYRPRKYG